MTATAPFPRAPGAAQAAPVSRLQRRPPDSATPTVTRSYPPSRRRSHRASAGDGASRPYPARPPRTGRSRCVTSVPLLLARPSRLVIFSARGHQHVQPVAPVPRVAPVPVGTSPLSLLMARVDSNWLRPSGAKVIGVSICQAGPLGDRASARPHWHWWPFWRATLRPHVGALLWPAGGEPATAPAVRRR
jgi:hypothetical protein